MKKEMEAPNLPTRDRTNWERGVCGPSLSSPVGPEVQDLVLLVGDHRRRRRGQKQPGGWVTRSFDHLTEREGGTTTPTVNDQYAADCARNLNEHAGERHETQQEQKTRHERGTSIGSW